MLRLKALMMLFIFGISMATVQAQEKEAYVNVNPDNYKAEVIDYAGPEIVFFYADWCPYSGSLLPVYTDIEKEYAGQIKFLRFKLGDEYKDFASQEGMSRWAKLKEDYGVDTLPTLVMLNQGKESDRMAGRPEKELVQEYRLLLSKWIDSNIINPQDGNRYCFEGTLLLHEKQE